jgi:hypothetical protein
LGSVHSALGPPSGNGPTHRSLSAQQTETGDLIPPSSARFHRSILAGRRRLTREGDAREEVWTMGNPWVAVGWTEAHHSGISMAVVLGQRGDNGAGPVAGSRCSGNWSASSGVLGCHTRFLRPKPDAHRMYAHDQVVIHTVRM